MAEIKEERVRLLLPALSIGLAMAALIIAKTGRDALFFQGGGSLIQLPLIYINIAAGAIPLALLFVKAMKIWGARPARVGIMLFAAGVMAVAAPFLEPGSNTLMLVIFIFIPAVFGLLFASLWLLASDIFEKVDKREAARAFGKMGAATLAGGTLGGLVAKALAPYLDAKWLILLSALIILGVAALVVLMHRRFETPLALKQTAGDKPRAGLIAPLRNRYAVTLISISMFGALAGLLIEFQFYAAAASAGMGSQGNANFFANFYILLNVSSLLLQLFLTPRIQDKVGLGGGLMILPLVLVGSATFATAAATAFSRSALRVAEGGLRSSIHRSIWEQAFIAVDSAERSSVKIFVDGIAARGAEAIGALAILFWLMRVAPGGAVPTPLDTSPLTWAILATVIVWVGITQVLRLQLRREQLTRKATADQAAELVCERFPDQCPCTTELGKGVA